MCAKWINKSDKNEQGIEHSVDVLLSKLNSSVKIKSYEFDEYLTAIEPYIVFNKEIPRSEQGEILYKTAKNLSNNGQLIAKQLLGEITREENDFLKNSKEINYILAGSISIYYQNELKKTIINGTPIVFSRSHPKQYDQKSAIKEWENLMRGKIPQFYTTTRISIKARTFQEAYDIAIDALDLLRGIWNLYLNDDLLVRFGGQASPINKIRLGPFHTLHLPNGKSATNGIFWYEQDFVEDIRNLNSNWKQLNKFEKRIRNYLSKHPYKLDVEDSIRRYTRALDFRDLHISFLELWIILEKLTATTNAKYEVMVRRISFLYENNILHKELMQSLRLFRNENIHSGQRSEKFIEKRIYQLKRFVEVMLKFHIQNHFKFKSLEEAAEFLDLPACTEELKKKSEAIKKNSDLTKKAIKFRRRKPVNS